MAISFSLFIFIAAGCAIFVWFVSDFFVSLLFFELQSHHFFNDFVYFSKDLLEKHSVTWLFLLIVNAKLRYYQCIPKSFHYKVICSKLQFIVRPFSYKLIWCMPSIPLICKSAFSFSIQSSHLSFIISLSGLFTRVSRNCNNGVILPWVISLFRSKNDCSNSSSRWPSLCWKTYLAFSSR